VTNNAQLEMRDVTPDAALSPAVQKCAAQHFGPWMIETAWFERAVAAVKAGIFVAHRPKAAAGEEEDDARSVAYRVTADGIAIVSIEGQMQKGDSSFGGTSTVRLRQAVRQAVRDPAVKGIMLLVDSPGGTVAGTDELAADVAAAAKVKPLHAHIEDLGASAGYYVAAQAAHVTATASSLVGSIGTVAVVEDYSGQAAKEGVVVHVISTGAYKGAFTPGAPISEEHLKYLQGYVTAFGDQFIAAVAAGRGVAVDRVRAWADGRIHLAADAKAMGMIDAVCGQDAAMEILRNAVKKGSSNMWNPLKAIAGLVGVSSAEPVVDAGASAAALSAAAAPPAVAAAPSTEQPVAPSAAVPAAPVAPAVAAAPSTEQPVAPSPAPASPGAPGPAASAPDAMMVVVSAEMKEDVVRDLRAECKAFIDAFGQAGATWFAEGKTLAEARDLHMAALKADNARLAEEVGRLKADGSARGEPTPVSFAVDGGAAGGKTDLASKIGPNMARVAAGLKFAKKQG
jgi:signal peptide peptidase SppA